MENVTKALLIAAGMFLAILILSSLVIFYNRISDFYAQQHEATMIEQNQEFNSRFENYNGREIRGNELISVINRIVDYNNLYADLQGYKRVIITVDLKNHASDLAQYDGNNVLLSDEIQNKSNDDHIKSIANASAKSTTSAEYHEYDELKKVMFKCTEVTYDLDTRRVNGMKFEAILTQGPRRKLHTQTEII